MAKNKNDQPGRVYRTPIRWGVAGAVMLVAVIVLAGCGDDDTDQMGPEAALNTFADGINANSVDDAMAAFAEQSRMIDHPLHPGELHGKAEVRRGVTQTVSFARVDPDPYSISDVVVDGDTVSWSYVWINDDDEEFCADGNEIDVNDDGLIVELRWGDDPGECDE
jgi:hypothetical protein